MPEHLDQRIAREDQIAELAPPAAHAENVGSDPVRSSKYWQQVAEQFELVLLRRSGQIRIIARDLLQAKARRNRPGRGTRRRCVARRRGRRSRGRIECSR